MFNTNSMASEDMKALNSIRIGFYMRSYECRATEIRPPDQFTALINKKKCCIQNYLCTHHVSNQIFVPLKAGVRDLESTSLVTKILVSG